MIPFNDITCKQISESGFFLFITLATPISLNFPLAIYSSGRILFLFFDKRNWGFKHYQTVSVGIMDILLTLKLGSLMVLILPYLSEGKFFLSINVINVNDLFSFVLLVFSKIFSQKKYIQKYQWIIHISFAEQKYQRLNFIFSSYFHV